MSRCEHCGSIIGVYQKQYGKSAEYLAAKFGVSTTTIHHRHKDGTLAAAIKRGTLSRKVNDSLYRRRYGLSITEISKKIKRNIAWASRLHHSGRLEQKLREA